MCLVNLVFQRAIDVQVRTDSIAWLFVSFFVCFQSLLWTFKSRGRAVARSFDSTCRYVDDVLFIDNPGFGDCLDVINPSGFTMRNTIDSSGYAPYLNLYRLSQLWRWRELHFWLCSSFVFCCQLSFVQRFTGFSCWSIDMMW